METKLCRICGKLGENYVHIFKTEGLKNKIETCLPIIVSPLCLLPDTICSECLENVDNFYSFIKNCLQNIIVLEAQYDITESCLKTKRKHEKSCLTESSVKHDKSTQTDDDTENRLKTLVSYEIDSDSEGESNASEGKVVLPPRKCDLITEITQRKTLKRKADTILPYKPKIFKMDMSNRRKSKQPKKLEHWENNCAPGLSFSALERICEQMGRNIPVDPVQIEKLGEISEADKLSALEQVQRELNNSLLQVCLLCEMQFANPSALSTHVYEIHGIDVTQPLDFPKKKMPDLLKITDVKVKNESADAVEAVVGEEVPPPTLQPSYVCPVCPAMFTNRGDLFTHMKVKHPAQAALLCGLCFQILTSYVGLNNHMEICRTQHNITAKYLCKVCCYSDDNSKLVENHVVVHDFVISLCKKQAKMFDPYDYVGINENSDSIGKLYTCTECEQDQATFATFKDFSAHRRSRHQIFHCDLCNKFYGRNSHLWKHVNRLHKGHPSITCQLCYKTSASKYHLAQHFNKIHAAKPSVLNHKNRRADVEDDFMSQKFQAFDFQSVKQSFMRQEMLEKGRKADSEGAASDAEDVFSDEGDAKDSTKSPPKEIDSSSDLYTNIITNYTPPQNEGEFKCPKCLKGFHKKTLLKKHKKNCRPRLQKDLLTRCKTCSRIFKDRQSLTKHLINYHSEYVCEICSQKVQSKCEIVSHIRFSHPNCHLFCSCGNILRNRVDLAAHKADHCNSFVCQFCGDALPTKIKLKMHILSLHRKILSLSCGICLKLFETQHILREHVNLVHRDRMTPLISCTVCGKNYGSKWKTYDHLNKSHGRIFKACKACLEVFDTEEALLGHYNQAHAPQTKANVAPVIAAAASEPKHEAAPVFESDDDDKVESESEVSVDVDVGEKLEDADAQVSLLEKRLLGKKCTDGKANKKSANKTCYDDTECGYAQNSNSLLLQNSSKRTVYVNSNDPSLCEICLKTWPAKKHLWQHYIRCHKTVAATVCGICLKTNADYESLQLHLRETHPTLLHGQGFGSNFICRICGRYHNASSKLKLHMAIHENFDWAMLNDDGAKCDGDDSLVVPNDKSNGFDDDERKHDDDDDDGGDDINYESMIERVECTSESEECDESDDAADKLRRTSSDEESDEGDEGGSENSLESQMLKNMLTEKTVVVTTKVEPPDDVDEIKVEPMETLVVKEEVTSSSDDDDDDDDDVDDGGEGEESTSDSYDDELPYENGEGKVRRLLGGQKPDELDSAIRSISYDGARDVDDELDSDFGELQTHSLNEHEIESAVDSIL